MRTQLGALTLTAVLLIGTAVASPGSRENTLAEDQMASLFGGAPNQQCCETDQNCTGAGVPGCVGFHGDPTGCTNGIKPYHNKAYAKKCQTKDPACPTCDCTDYAKDANGKAYDCIDYWTCQYIVGKCSQLKYHSGQVGTYSCGHNCPP